MQDLSHWLIYGAAFIGPFVQEDAAVLGATSASISMSGHEAALLGAVFAGLVVSDTWKYWAGRLAKKSRTAARWVAMPSVQAARERVLNRLGVTLLVARFVPGTRIPLYVACGVFHAPFWRFLLYISLSGMLYIGLAFVLFHSLDSMTGSRLRALAPFIALSLAALFIGVSWLRNRAKKAAT